MEKTKRDRKRKSKTEEIKPSIPKNKIAKVSSESKKVLSYLKLNEMFYKAIITLYRYYTGAIAKHEAGFMNEFVLTDLEKKVFIFIKRKYTIVTPDFILVLRYVMLLFFKLFSPLREKHFLMKNITLDLRDSSWFYYLELRDARLNQEQNFVIFSKLLKTMEFSEEEKKIFEKAILFLQYNFPEETSILNDTFYKKIEIILVLGKYLETLQNNEVPENLFDEGRGTDVEEAAYARDKLITLLWDDLISNCDSDIRKKYRRDKQGLFWRLTDEHVIEISKNGKHSFLIEYILLKITRVLTAMPHNAALTIQVFLSTLVQAAETDSYSYYKLLHLICIKLSEKKYYDYLITKCIEEKNKAREVEKRLTQYNKDQIGVDPVIHRQLYYLFDYTDKLVLKLADRIKQSNKGKISYSFAKPLTLLHYMFLNLNSFFNLNYDIGIPTEGLQRYSSIINAESQLLPRVKPEEYEKFMQENYIKDLSIKHLFS